MSNPTLSTRNARSTVESRTPFKTHGALEGRYVDSPYPHTGLNSWRFALGLTPPGQVS